MVQYKVWYRKACGDSLLIKKADRFWDNQLKKRHWRHFLVRTRSFLPLLRLEWRPVARGCIGRHDAETFPLPTK